MENILLCGVSALDYTIKCGESPAEKNAGAILAHWIEKITGEKTVGCKGAKIIADKIIDGTFDYGAYNAPYFNVLYGSNIIINAILKTNQIEKYKIILAYSVKDVQLVKRINIIEIS